MIGLGWLAAGGFGATHLQSTRFPACICEAHGVGNPPPSNAAIIFITPYRQGWKAGLLEKKLKKEFV
jgi:hypothetical protein